MLTLDHPIASTEAEPQPTSSSIPKLSYSIRTIKRDLKLLTEQHLYYAEIEISGGANRVTTVDMEDFCLPAAVLEQWKTMRSKKQSPQVLVFNELVEAVKQLQEQRRLIYRDHTVHLHLYRTIPGSHLEAFMTAFTTLQTRSNTLLSNVLTSHAEAKAKFLNDEIRPLLEAGYFSDEETRRKLEVYAHRFPKLEQIQVRFGVQLKGPFRMQTWREALAEDTEAQRLVAERDRFAAEIAQSTAARLAADQKIQQAEQERRAYQTAYAYQQQQIRSAIDSKVSEVQHQVLNLLYRSLKKLSEKDYQPGKLPPGLRQQLVDLAESASLLSQTDRSLAQVVTDLHQVNAIARVPQPEEDRLRTQVDELLTQLESRLRVPALEVVEILGDDDRATWLRFA
jgi:hypothetical protein